MVMTVDNDVDMHVRVAVLEERISRMEKAVELQANEYERRLAELNHANAKQLQDQATFVRRDIYDVHIAETVRWRENVLSQLSERKGGITSMREMLFRVVPLLISAVTLVWLIIKGVI